MEADGCCPKAVMAEKIDFGDPPAGDGVVILSKAGHIVSANLQAESILRRRLPRGQTFLIREYISKPYRQETRNAREKALQGHSCSNLLAKVFPDAGHPAAVLFSMDPIYGEGAEVTGIFITLRNPITIQPKGPDRFRESIWAYDTLFENLAEGIFSINNRWRITAFNRRAQEITGFQREEVMGRNCWDIFRSDLCRTDCPLKRTMETGALRMDQEVRITEKGGRTRPLLVNTSVIRNKQGRVVGAVESFRPLTPIEAPEAYEILPAHGHDRIVGRSPGLVNVLNMLPDVAASDATVLIQGESGTGKELIAKAIHDKGPGKEGPFVAVNCSALAETLLESELFGHVKAAFSGALYNKAGRFELAKGGTLLLDEVGDIKASIQVKLLRVLEERVFERVGGTRPIRMNSRIIATTNKSLAREVSLGRFREDLYYRLRTVPLFIPPLRERKSDIPMLVDHFLALFGKKYGKNVRGVDPRVLDRFQQYHWPGNIRELQHVMEHAFVFVKGPIIVRSHLPAFESTHAPRSLITPPTQPAPGGQDEKATLQEALDQTHNRRAAAHLLGISRSTLWRRMKHHGLL